MIAKKVSEGKQTYKKQNSTLSPTRIGLGLAQHNTSQSWYLPTPKLLYRQRFFAGVAFLKNKYAGNTELAELCQFPTQRPMRIIGILRISELYIRDLEVDLEDSLCHWTNDRPIGGAKPSAEGKDASRRILSFLQDFFGFLMRVMRDDGWNVSRRWWWPLQLTIPRAFSC